MEQKTKENKVAVPKEFMKILKDFYVDIFTTFPECKEKVDKDLIVNLMEEKGESAKKTAEREGWEETAGILGNKQDIKNLIKKNLLDKVVYDDGKGRYTVFLVFIPYDKTLPYKLRKIYKNALKNEPEKVFAHNGLYEKDKAAWFPLEKLSKQKHRFRKWYRPVVQQTIDLFN